MDSSIELSDWTKASVRTDAEQNSYDDSGSWRSHRRKMQGWCFYFLTTSATLLVATLVVAFIAFFPGQAIHFRGSSSSVVVSDSCNPKKHEEWLQKEISKKDGQQYTVIDRIDHDPSSFTQGLTFANGILYESTGLLSESKVRKLDPSSSKGEILQSVDIDPKLFGEGITYWEGKLVQITWKSNRGFIYNAETLEVIMEFKFSTTQNEGWGITWDWCHDEFVVTDGSPYLHFWDAETLTEKRRIKVHRLGGGPAKNLNEIEFWRGRILANVWFEDVLLVINPETGKTEKEYDFSTLWPKKQREKQGANVFNGISISDDDDVLYVTGKLWNRIHSVKLN